jgi:hypothetical protein
MSARVRRRRYRPSAPAAPADRRQQPPVDSFDWQVGERVDGVGPKRGVSVVPARDFDSPKGHPAPRERTPPFIRGKK